MLWFDLDDTLWAMTENSSGVLRRLWHEIPAITKAYPEGPERWLEVYHSINASLWQDYAKALITRSYLRRERFARPLEAGGLPREDAEEASVNLDRIYLDMLGSCSGLISGAREFLDYAVTSPWGRPGIISNGFKEVQHHKLRSAGIYGYFSAIVLSDDIEVNKPDRRIFDHALEVTGTRAEDSVIIGDNPITDILGALEAGWAHAIWYNPSGTPAPAELSPYPPERLAVAGSMEEAKDMFTEITRRH